MVNETNSSSSPVYELDTIFDFWVPGVFLNTIGILGLIGNVISIIILSRPQMRSSINCILIGLASYDSILILTGILMFGLPSLYTYTQFIFSFYYWKIFPYITPVVYPVGLIAQTGSAYLTLCVTIERYVAVCLPLRARSLCTYGRARCYVVSIGAFAVIYNLPRFWEVTWKTTYYDEFKQNYTEVAPTELRNNPLYISVYITWMYLVVMYFFPFLCLAAFNLRIYFQIRKANSERARLSRLQKKEIGLATMLMCVVVVFFVCNVLALVVNVLEVMEININALTQTSNLLITLNSSVNFIIYCIFGEKFKRIFYRLFCPIMKNAGQPEIVCRYSADNQSQRFLNLNSNNHLNNSREGGTMMGRNTANNSSSGPGNDSNSSGGGGSGSHESSDIIVVKENYLCLAENKEFIPLKLMNQLVRSHSDCGTTTWWKRGKVKSNNCKWKETAVFKAEDWTETSSPHENSASSLVTDIDSQNKHYHHLVLPGTNQDITITVNVRTLPSSSSKEHSFISSCNFQPWDTIQPRSSCVNHVNSSHHSLSHMEAAREAVKLLSNSSSIK